MDSTPMAPRRLGRRLLAAARSYPRSYWAMLAGYLVGIGGVNVIWPFITLFARRMFDVPLSHVTIVFTVYSVISGAATMIAGPIADRFGRKLGLFAAFFATAILLFLMGLTQTYVLWVALMLIWAIFWPFIQISGYAMVADWIDEQRRTTAYAMIVISFSAGVAIGPAIGGFIIDRSFPLAFTLSAVAALVTALVVLLFVRESLHDPHATRTESAIGSYRLMLRDRPFLRFVGIYALHALCGTMMFMLLPVYANEQFAVSGGRTGIIMSVGALMPVILQYSAARIATRFHAPRVLALGAGCYVAAFLIVATGTGFPQFLIGFCVLQIGLLITLPTASALTANAAPPNMRGRYMSVYSLASWAGFGLGPLVGGLLNDHITPAAAWYGGAILSLVAAIGYLSLGPLFRRSVESRGES